jgi:hypothetical protein
MPIKNQAKKEGNKERKRTGWDEAISDARRKIRGLEFSIAVFRQRKKAGEPWPGATQN